MSRREVRLWHSDTGSVAAEHVLLITLIAVVIVAGLFALGEAVNGNIQSSADCVDHGVTNTSVSC